MGTARITRSSVPSAVMAYSSSPAASSFYSSVLSGGPDCSLSQKSSATTPHRNRLSSRFQHSKSHSISGSREATPVRVASGSNSASRRTNSEKFDRHKTASLPLPKRRQLSMGANSTGDEEMDRDDETGPKRATRVNILNEDVYNLSTAGDSASFVTITGNAFSNRRDSNCTLNSNSYKEQYILGSNYNNNINRHSQVHYDAMLLNSSVRLKGKDNPEETTELGSCGAPDYLVTPQKLPDCEPRVEPKLHHYETNSKSLEDIL